MSGTAAGAPSRPRVWLLAARPATLPAAAVPVVVGTAVAVAERGLFRPMPFLATLLAALLIQVGTNFANDYSDFHRGADGEGRLGPLRVTQSGLLAPEAVRTGIAVAFALAVIAGLYLAWIGGWPIVVIGLLSLLCGLAYTGGPWPLGYHGLGDLFVFVFFGLVAVTGSAYVQTGSWSALAVAASIPVGLLTTNLLVANNLRDLPTDRLAGKETLAVRLGERRTRLQYVLLAAGAYAVPVALAVRLARPWLLLPLLSAPLAVRLASQVHGGASGGELNAVLRRSGVLLLLFGSLLAAGLLLGDR